MKKDKTESLVILHQAVDENSLPDEMDVLVQAHEISRVLIDLGYNVRIVPVKDMKFVDEIRESCDGVFNLVETLNEKAANSHLVPQILEFMNVSFTGSGSNAIAVTTDKILTKSVLYSNGVPTAQWCSLNSSGDFEEGTYIFKPVSEDASLGITSENVCIVKDMKMAQELIVRFQKRYGLPFFCEKYISGREFNVSVIGINGRPKVFHPAEMIFIGDNEEGKIVDYDAKWNEDSENYRNSFRSFSNAREDRSLFEKLEKITCRCWDLFGLAGYARVDFRVDENGNPYVLEINANPCLSSNGGFAAAVLNGGFSFPDTIRIIVSEALNENKKRNK